MDATIKPSVRRAIFLAARRLALALVLVLAWTPAALAQRPTEPLPHSRAPRVEIGQPAPDFALPDQDGKIHKLSDYRGSIVVLEWTNPDCPEVGRINQRQMVGKLSAFYKDSRRVMWLSILSLPYLDQALVNRFRQESALLHPALHDKTGRVAYIYGATHTPQIFVVDDKGVLRYVGAFNKPGDLDKPDKEQTNYVRLAVEPLLQGQLPAVERTEPHGCPIQFNVR